MEGEEGREGRRRKAKEQVEGKEEDAAENEVDAWGEMKRAGRRQLLACGCVLPAAALRTILLWCVRMLSGACTACVTVGAMKCFTSRRRLRIPGDGQRLAWICEASFVGKGWAGKHWGLIGCYGDTGGCMGFDGMGSDAERLMGRNRLRMV